MTSQRHTFATALLIVGEGQNRKQATVRDVVLEMTVVPAGAPPRTGSVGSFLDVSVRAEGMLFEACRPGSSLLAKGRQAVLKLTAVRHWALVSVLIVDLGEIRSVSPKERLYQWKFLVLGKPNERLHLSGAVAADELSIEELLGAVRSDVDHTPGRTDEATRPESAARFDGAT